MSMSVSVKKATNKTSIKHNNRKMSDKEKERNSHIDSERTHENKYLVQEDIRELYQREFSEPLENYNAKQKRNDRKIDDYYKHIQSSKKTAVQQEMIIQVGDKDDFLNKENCEVANTILEEWFHEFEERNPNLKVYNAVIHNDEASPHMHLNFVPVAEGYKRGLEKQVAFDRAIIQQDSTLNKTRPFEDWRENEVKLLEKKLLERGIERKLVGTNQYKDVNEYKEKKDLEKEIQQLKKNLSEKKNELQAYSKQVPNEIDVQAKRQMKNIEIPTGEKNIFGKPKMKTEKKATKNVILSESDYKDLVGAARDNKKMKGHINNLMSRDLAKENKNLVEKNEQIRGKYNNLVNKFNSTIDDYNELANENESLRDRISDLKQDIGLIYESTKEFLKERTDGLKAFKNVFKDFVGKVKSKTIDFQEKRNIPLERNEFEKIHSKELRKEKSHGMER